jgi:hypothetical protein
MAYTDAHGRGDTDTGMTDHDSGDVWEGVEDEDFVDDEHGDRVDGQSVSSSSSSLDMDDADDEEDDDDNGGEHGDFNLDGRFILSGYGEEMDED